MPWPAPSAQREFERRANPNDKQAQALLDEMRQHIKKLEEMRCAGPLRGSSLHGKRNGTTRHSHPRFPRRKYEDPRMSFCTPEFREAQRVFTENLKKNFGRPIEWAMVKDHPWSTPQLRK